MFSVMKGVNFCHRKRILQASSTSKKRQLLLLLLSTTFHFVLPSCYAWWDMGHMAIASVAALQLTSEELNVLTHPLSQWSNEFPGLSTLVTSAVWADHIKCEEPSKFCSGMASFYGWEIFNPWHYVNNPYNPYNISVDPIKYYPSGQTGALWLLSSLLPHWAGHSAKVDTDARRTNRHVVSRENVAEAASTDGKPLPIFTWNLKLRLLVHIFGDVHQPLHSANAFSEYFPYGDSGGNKVFLDWSKSRFRDSMRSEVNTLHQLWDSCGGLYVENWPSHNETMSLLLAKQLTTEYPLASVENAVENATTFAEILDESYNLAITVAYQELYHSPSRQTQDIAADAALPYQPSDSYVLLVRDVCRRRLVIAGYRLAKILKVLAGELNRAVGRDRGVLVAPPFVSMTSNKRDNFEKGSFIATQKGLKTLSVINLIAFTCGVACIIAIVLVFVCASKHKLDTEYYGRKARFGASYIRRLQTGTTFREEDSQNIINGVNRRSLRENLLMHEQRKNT